MSESATLVPALPGGEENSHVSVTSESMFSMPRIPRVGGPFGLALAAFDVWRRLPPAQRRLITAQLRKHGPRVAEQALFTLRALRDQTRRR